MEAVLIERSPEAMEENEASLERIDERVEQLGKSMDQMNCRVGKFESQVNDRFGRLETQVNDRFGRLESQVNDRFGRLESGIGQIQNQFQELQHTLVQMSWGLAVALLIVLGGVIAT